MGNGEAMNVVAILQARMSSTRLPGKVLMNLAGKTMLEHVYDRVQAARLVNQVVIATTTDPGDDELFAFCKAKGYEVIRGPLEDVLGRFVLAADAYQADIIVRVTTDCPLADPQLIDDVVQEVLTGDYDYVSNRLPPEPRTIPIGLDVEGFTKAALDRANSEATRAEEREHVTPYIYNNQNRYRCLHLRYPEIGHAEERWTVDTPEDFAFAQAILRSNPQMSWRKTLVVVNREE